MTSETRAPAWQDHLREQDKRLQLFFDQLARDQVGPQNSWGCIPDTNSASSASSTVKSSAWEKDSAPNEVICRGFDREALDNPATCLRRDFEALQWWSPDCEGPEREGSSRGQGAHFPTSEVEQ